MVYWIIYNSSKAELHIIYIKRLLKIQWFEENKCLRNKNTNYVKSTNLKILVRYSVNTREACKNLIQKVMIARDNNIDIEDTQQYIT